ncbi:hypothetical protein T4C_8542 [Trichinella pseudospiralis]|uniref:Uncharacterized protein n=1 Tax=Trichinella pseudospiralis TaxID=6337 RepID=A0A0V1JL89_TRIPS|nr:hypothetical protein T4C_8542 [Trichinella pseudospiralis]
MYDEVNEAKKRSVLFVFHMLRLEFAFDAGSNPEAIVTPKEKRKFNIQHTLRGVLTELIFVMAFSVR